MSASPDLVVRRAELPDAEAAGRLLHDFNSEFEEPTPGPSRLGEGVRHLLTDGQTMALSLTAQPAAGGIPAGSSTFDRAAQ
jgi:hypothetical protein